MRNCVLYVVGALVALTITLTGIALAAPMGTIQGDARGSLYFERFPGFFVAKAGPVIVRANWRTPEDFIWTPHETPWGLRSGVLTVQYYDAAQAKPQDEPRAGGDAIRKYERELEQKFNAR